MTGIAPRGRHAHPLSLLLAVLVIGPGPRVQAGENPLAPPDTSSPRATVQSFLSRIEEIHRIASLGNHDGKLRRRVEPKSELLLRCFDTRELAPSTAGEKCFEAAVLLKEIFDRVDLADPRTYPDAARAREDKIDRFRIPGTEITLVQLDSGPDKGEYRFSSETVGRAPQFFERVRHLPYRAQATTRGLYQLYIGLQGSLVPTSWIQSLPAWALQPIKEHALWQWLSLFGFSVLGFALVAASYRIGRLGFITNPLSAGVCRFAFPAVWIGVAYSLDWIFSTQIRMTGEVLISLRTIFQVQLFLAGIVIALQAISLVANAVIRFQKLRPDGIDSQLIRLGFRVLTFLLVAWIVVQGADSLGFAVAPLIAGFGVTGLAVALAAQSTIENLLAGIALFTDKPIRVGDLCRFGDHEGHVEMIGIRSTRIRALDRSLITIPNAEFAKLELINYSRRDRFLLQKTIAVPAQQAAAEVGRLLADLEQLLLGHPSTASETVEVRLTGYQESRLDVEIFAYVLTRSWSEFLVVQKEVLLQIMERVRSVPTSTESRSLNASTGTGQRGQLQLWRDEDEAMPTEAGADRTDPRSSQAAANRVDPPASHRPSTPPVRATRGPAEQRALG